MTPSPIIVTLALFGLLWFVKLAVTAAVIHGGHLAAVALIASCFVAAHYLNDSPPEPPVPGA